MTKINYLNKNRSLKFVQLYFKLGFKECGADLFKKTYSSGETFLIDSDKMSIDFCGNINVDNSKFKLNNQKNFVILELIDSLLLNNASAKDIKICFNNDYDVEYKSIRFKCFEYNTFDEDLFSIETKGFTYVYYESRLLSGLLERRYIISKDGSKIYSNKDKNNIIHNDDFIYEGSTLIKYVGNDSIVNIPNGTERLSVAVFWDNQVITRVHFPEGVLSIGGDTFYNCENLREVNIPKTCIEMGDNPFAGTRNLKIVNESNHFVYENDALYDENKELIIHFNPNSDKKEFVIPSSVHTIGKHAFYKTNLYKIIVPNSVKRLINNPFSAGKYLKLENHSSNYIVEDDIIYTANYKKVIGALNSIKTKCLRLKDVELIQRNSFFNCDGLEKIVLPSSLQEIEYNPFIGCKNIQFESLTQKYKVEDGILYNEDFTKLICAPTKFVKGEFKVRDSVKSLERGAFSGNLNLTSIDFKNVNIINKSCFTNCNNLKNVRLSDFVSYIGEWAFAHCKNLNSVTYSELTECDPKAFLNSNVKIKKYKPINNYLINSENLYVLRTMLGNYRGKIDSICIDPPYNSDINYIGYKDSNFNGSYWNFMKDRLEVSYELLSEKGFLVINIDEGEVKELTDLCKQLFTNEHVEVHKWKKKHPYFDVNRVVLNPNKIQTDFEYIIICKKSSSSILKKIKQPYIDNDIICERESDVPETFDCFGTTSSAKDEINEIFGRRDYFSTPKPVKLMKELIRATTNKNSIIMDYFAGSGTVGQAVDELNKEDDGNRKFILVTNDESNICDKVTCRRLEKFNINFIYIK